MALVPPSVAKQAELLRLDGNFYFKKERIGAAIDAYTEAITLCPNVAVYRTNRALCYRKRKEWARVEDDCRKAIELDGNSVKGHYMLGLALLEKEEYADAIKKLEKALDLGRVGNPNGYMFEEIWQVLADAKYKEWERESSERAWTTQKLFESCEKALTEQQFLADPQAEDDSRRSGSDHLERLELLKEVFHRAAEADEPTEVPDYLCCKITLEVFRDPVISPSGITYERSVILEHLNKVGKFDPITREPLDQHHLVPNLAIKEAVRAYLKEHCWAYKLS